MLAKQLATAKAVEAVFVEEVFQSWLYTGNGSTQTINNGIDLAGKGGLVWFKCRNIAYGHDLVDTVRGRRSSLQSNSSIAARTLDPNNNGSDLASFNSSGFSLGQPANTNLNGSGDLMASWTFRKQPKFFDVVTWTGTTGARTLTHNLGSTPGVIIVKSTTNTAFWCVYHSALGPTKYLQLSKTDAEATQSTIWNNTAPTSTQFTVGAYLNQAQTYVAYLFAHDAGGFGLTGTDNVISCGSFTTDASGNATVNLGYEPQWLLIKQTNAAASWMIHDVMRGMSLTTYAELNPNTSAAESSGASEYIVPQSSGFKAVISQNNTFIYIAIRRGPMKTPTSGTSVFSPNVQNASSTIALTTGFPVDLIIGTQRSRATFNSTAVFDRLRGTRGVASGANWLATNSTNAENSDYGQNIDRMDGFLDLFFNTSQGVTSSTAYWSFRRAPGFFDVVCYTGTGSARTVAHNLGVVPELMIVKGRSSSSTWGVWNKDIFAANPASVLALQLAQAVSTGASTYFNSTAPTSSVFTVGTADATNGSSVNFVAYLFASCPGVSKVGSYTGNGSSQTINMGFTGGARFFLVKRTDSTGDWWVYDSARGIVSNADPALRLNSTAAEVTSADAVDTASSGLIVNQESTCNINVNGATYIYLGIA